MYMHLTPLQLCFKMARDHLEWARKFRKVGDNRYFALSIESARECHFKAREILRGGV